MSQRSLSRIHTHTHTQTLSPSTQEQRKGSDLVELA